MWFADKLGPAPQNAVSQKGTARQGAQPAAQRSQPQQAAPAPRAQQSAPAPAPEKKKKKGWFG